MTRSSCELSAHWSSLPHLRSTGRRLVFQQVARRAIFGLIAAGPRYDSARDMDRRTAAPPARDDRRRARRRRSTLLGPRADRARARDVRGDVVGALLVQVVARAPAAGFPTEAPWVLVGPGEGAGVIDVGDGLAVAVRIESHNHPSAVEPYQGAATGVGGIIRDIFSMGARPIALDGPAAVRSARRRPHPLPLRRRRVGHQRLRQRGRRADRRRRGRVRRLLPRQPARERALPRRAAARAARARPRRGRGQPRGAARLVDRPRRHRRRERARVRRLRGGRRRRSARRCRSAIRSRRSG